MRTTKIAFVLATAAVLAGTSGAAIAAHTSRDMVPVSQVIRQRLASLDDAIASEAAKGCVETDERGERRFCGTSKEKMERLHDDTMKAVDELRARPPAAREHAHAVIRAFRKNGGLPVSYVSTGANPYRDDGAVIESYVDDTGNEYWIDPQNDVLVQMGPNAGAHQAPRQARSQTRLSVKELREKAVVLIGGQLPDFGSRRSSLHPLEDNKKGEIYFFRWDDFSAPAKESELPPFVQVGLYADGTLASYTDTLTR